MEDIKKKNKRAGTENVAEIVGLGKAIELADKNIEEYNNKLLELRDYYISEVEKKYTRSKIKWTQKKKTSRKCQHII